MNFLTAFLYSLLVFIGSNCYLLYQSYSIKLPIIFYLFLFLVFIFINLFPSFLTTKLYDPQLMKIRNGYRLLIIFLINVFLSSILYLVSIFYYSIDFKILFVNFFLLFISLLIVFWNGMIRVYLFSKQLGIRYRLIGFLLGMVPIAHIVMLIKIIIVCLKEVQFENQKIQKNLERKDKKICKTKYPILLVHGIFFRDSELINYWGRIPEELEKNGATIFYGNHSSSLAVKDSANELSNRIKEIIEKTGCEKVNIIAHSKGGLDSRYAISNLGMDQYVASLSMINTPNHGCEFADYLLHVAPESFKNNVSNVYNISLKKLGDPNPDFMAGVTDLTKENVEKLNRQMLNKESVYYKSYGSILKKPTSGRFPLNLTTSFVKMFDGPNDGLVGIESFPYNDNFDIISTPYKRGISHGDVIDLNRENIDGYDVREFYVKLVSDLKNRGL